VACFLVSARLEVHEMEGRVSAVEGELKTQNTSGRGTSSTPAVRIAKSEAAGNADGAKVRVGKHWATAPATILKRERKKVAARDSKSGERLERK
jgi:hypothetical protein